MVGLYCVLFSKIIANVFMYRRGRGEETWRVYVSIYLCTYVCIYYAWYSSYNPAIIIYFCSTSFWIHGCPLLAPPLYRSHYKNQCSYLWNWLYLHNSSIWSFLLCIRERLPVLPSSLISRSFLSNRFSPLTSLNIIIKSPPSLLPHNAGNISFPSPFSLGIFLIHCIFVLSTFCTTYRLVMWFFKYTDWKSLNLDILLNIFLDFL